MPFRPRRMHFKRSDKTNERHRKFQGQSGSRAVVGVSGDPPHLCDGAGGLPCLVVGVGNFHKGTGDLPSGRREDSSDTT